MRSRVDPWTGKGPGGWLAVLGSGLLLGSIISLMELIEQPMAGASLSAVWEFLSSKGGYWMGVGVVWAILGQLAEPRLATAPLIYLGLAASIALSLALLIPAAMSRLAWFGGGGSAGFGVGVLPMDARLAHLFWTNCFYGGLYLAAFTGVRRAARSRTVLARIQHARDESAIRLKEGQLEAFRRQLQPGVVTDALASLKALYRSNPSKADELVDLLVEFLRPAVRSLRAEATTLADEIDLARRYLALRAATTEERCTIVADACPVPQAPFPPRLLVPAVDHFCLAGRGVRLTMGRSEDGYRADLEAEVLAEGAIPQALAENMTLSHVWAGWRVAGRLAPVGAGMRWTLVVSPLEAGAAPGTGG